MRLRRSIARSLALILCFVLFLPDFLRAETASVIVTYDYDAFGNLIHSTGTTPNNYLFVGEQFDPDLGLYYNRARYLNVSTGRFWSMDAFEGITQEPLSLHKYAYVSDDPINKTDATGHDDLTTTIGGALPVAGIIAATVVVTLAYACVAYAYLTKGYGPCGNRNDDPTLSFYRGTSYWEGLDFVSPSPDLTRFVTSPDAESYDYGPGFYMTRQLPVALYFANNAGGTPTRPIKGGPAIINIQIKKSKWQILLSQGAQEGPMSGIPGQPNATQAFVPVQLILELKTLATDIFLWSVGGGPGI